MTVGGYKAGDRLAGKATLTRRALRAGDETRGPKGVGPRRYTPTSPGCSPPLSPGISAASVARPTAEPREKGQQGSLGRRDREEAEGEVQPPTGMA